MKFLIFFPQLHPPFPFPFTPRTSPIYSQSFLTSILDPWVPRYFHGLALSDPHAALTRSEDRGAGLYGLWENGKIFVPLRHRIRGIQERGYWSTVMLLVMMLS